MARGTAAPSRPVPTVAAKRVVATPVSSDASSTIVEATPIVDASLNEQQDDDLPAGKLRSKIEPSGQKVMTSSPTKALD